MPRALVIADSAWAVNDVLSTLPQGVWEVELLDDPIRSAAKVAELDPDVVIIDLQIKSMGGMAIVRQIRADPDIEEVPRLVLLLDREADGFLAKRAGADAWVVKPFQADELRRALGFGRRGLSALQALTATGSSTAGSSRSADGSSSENVLHPPVWE
jgi:CheY-like chemotaxis protein